MDAGKRDRQIVIHHSITKFPLITLCATAIFMTAGKKYEHFTDLRFRFEKVNYLPHPPLLSFAPGNSVHFPEETILRSGKPWHLIGLFKRTEPAYVLR